MKRSLRALILIGVLCASISAVDRSAQASSDGAKTADMATAEMAMDQIADKRCALGVCVSNGQISVGALVVGDAALIARLLGLGTRIGAAVTGLTVSSTLSQSLYPVLPFALVGAAGWVAWNTIPAISMAETSTEADG